MSDTPPSLPPAWGELVLLNGRQSETRFPLQTPVLLIGCQEGCDFRLNAADVGPAHCLLLHGADGPLLRDLRSAKGTFVNGECVSQAALRDGDTVVIGPFRFRFQAMPSLPSAEELRRTAQWEEKQRRLAGARRQTRAEYDALRAERAQYKQYLTQTTTQLHAERQALQRLAEKLAEREADAHRDQQWLQREKEALARRSLHARSDFELKRRELQDGWSQLRREQRQWHEEHTRQRAEADQQEKRLAAERNALIEERRHWTTRLADLRAEADGLENRIRHLRGQLTQHEETLSRVRESPPPLPAPALVLPSDMEAILKAREQRLEQTEQEALQRLEMLEQLANDLEDQRQQLLEQSTLLHAAQQRWQAERIALATQLEPLAQRLHQREQTLEASLDEFQQWQEELTRERQRLAARQAQLDARLAAWEGERTRLLAQLHCCEESPSCESRSWPERGAAYERQIRLLNEEVERLALALLDEPAPLSALAA
jgi:pSer/pThr/pTyr-binding forkhead associated (FHA) protein